MNSHSNFLFRPIFLLDQGPDDIVTFLGLYLENSLHRCNPSTYMLANSRNDVASPEIA